VENWQRCSCINGKQTQISIRKLKEKQVGMYLRNQNISDDSFDEQYKKGVECEKIHGHIKCTVKFDIRRMRNKSRKLYSLLSFIAYQLLVLTEIQNKVGNKNSFEIYF
jgi:hypothetical protein